MTPQLQQAIRLLQLSTLELRTEVQEALESNLMLEVEEDQDSGPPERKEQDQSDIQLAEMPKELAVDCAWEDTYEPPAAPYNGADHGGAEFEAQRGTTDTLHDHLRWQMEFSHFSDEDTAIAGTIVDSVDDDGYLTVSVEEILQIANQGGLEVEIEEVEAVLRQIQNFDPPGVGARDLRECLLIQLRQQPPESRWRSEALRLVGDHLDILAAHDYSQLMRRLGLDRAELSEVITFIQSLHPRPGSQISAQQAQYVIPDVFVRKKNGAWLVELNPDISPRIRINSEYARLIRRADNSEDNNCLKNHLQEARWFLKSLKSRNETLLKVATCIVERQQLFLEHGEEAMKPMVLHDVAEAVEMHESTISRVTTQKYMHTPRGIFELKYFFSSHVSTASGGEASSTAIRALIKKLIAAENPQKPLSDSKLAGILSEQGVNVARRTVAKYREAISIPSSSERKRLT